MPFILNRNMWAGYARRGKGYRLMVGIIALALSAVALVLGIVALAKAVELRDDLNRQKRQQGDLSDTLKQRLEGLAKSLSARESPFAPASSRSSPSSSPASQQSPPAPARREAPRPSPPPEPEPQQEQFINFDCAQCNQNIEAPIAMAGYHVTCPTCSALITVPLESSGAAAARAAAREDQPVIGDDVDMEEEVLKGATVRIDISKVFEDAEPPKRQIVIKRRG